MFGRSLSLSAALGILLIGCSQGSTAGDSTAQGSPPAANPPGGSGRPGPDGGPVGEANGGAINGGAATAGVGRGGRMGRGRNVALAPTASDGASGTWKSVSAILTKNCATCHSSEQPKARFDATSYAGVMNGYEGGPLVAAGKPDESNLVKAINGEAGLRKMPPRGTLAKEDVASISLWIKNGAKQD